MKRTFLFATIASVLSINAYAVSATVTSKDYVDTQDALKQDKITAGTTGNVVLYNGTQNGQTQFTGRAIYDENPIGIATDGIVAGTGVSYDILNYSLSLSYLFSDTGIWHREYENYADHTVVASFRYKYSREPVHYLLLI